MHTSHGYYIPGTTPTPGEADYENPKYRARCGGLAFCKVCRKEAGLDLGRGNEQAN